MAEVCRCVEQALIVARNLDDARRLIDIHVGRSLIHADFVVEQLPKLEECLKIDLGGVKEGLEKMGEKVDEPEEAKRWLDRAYLRFYRTIRECPPK